MIDLRLGEYPVVEVAPGLFLQDSDSGEIAVMGRLKHSGPSIILAFLQHLWVHDPERVKVMIARGGEEARLRIIRTVLFGGCLSGRRLHEAFRDELCRRIIWEEASPEIASDAKTVYKPDPEHIRSVLTRIRPDIVVCFGQLASEAVARQWPGKTIRAPHPACRRSDTARRLREAAGELIRADIANARTLFEDA
jgi:hypothetical protein